MNRDCVNSAAFGHELFNIAGNDKHVAMNRMVSV